MLDTLWASAALFSKPDIRFAIDAYERRLKLITSFDYNTTCNHPMSVYDKIIELGERIENLKILNNALLSSVKLLKPEHARVIRQFYFERLPKDMIIAKSQITEDNYKYRKRAALKKIAFFLNMMGITNEKFIALFNDEPLLVRNSLLAAALKEKTKRFHTADNAEKEAAK